MSSFAGAHRCRDRRGGCRGQAGRVERGPLMALRDGPEEAAFRATLRTWLEANVPSGLRGFRGWSGPALELGRDWSKRLARAGYAGLTWPKEYGGAGQPWRYQAVYLEELARAEAPQHLGVIGLGMAGPTIIAHGRPDQKTRYLAKILSAEDIWCQGFSEPGSGSDLASVRTRVELIGDRFVVNGQKVWSSYAHVADRCILLGRSATASEKHEGLTYLIVDMKSPGPEGSVAKLRWSEANQRLTKLAIEIIGREAQVADGDGAPAYWRHQQLRSRGNTIEAGTSEILRNIIAERVLGLPRSR